MEGGKGDEGGGIQTQRRIPAGSRTSKEASQVLGAVGVLDAVDEAIVLICLHASLDAVEGKGGQGGKDAG